VINVLKSDAPFVTTMLREQVMSSALQWVASTTRAHRTVE